MSVALASSFQKPVAAKADGGNTVNVYFFHVEGCSHCAEEDKFLTSFQSEHGYLNIIRYDYAESASQELLEKTWSVFEAGSSERRTPFTVVGGKYFVAFSISVREQMKSVFARYHENAHPDIMQKIISDEEILPSDFDHTSFTKITLPVLGEVDVQSVSLVLVSVILGFIDGINPCAMWVLLFLISMVMASRDKKRIWAVGGTFLTVSGLFYMVLMMAWIGTVSLLSAKPVFQIIIGILALSAGGWNIYSYVKARMKKDDGCEVTDAGQKKKLADKVRKIAMQSSLPLAVIGAAVLAIMVNAVELACSAGLPVVFSQILALNGIAGLNALVYVLIYIFFFMIDDLVIFSIAVFTFRIRPMSAKWSRYSHLAGGILMALIGVLMIFFPEILYFSFF